MGMIMIHCPATGRDVSTGIETSGVEELPERESHDVVSRMWPRARLDQRRRVACGQR